MSVSIPFDIQLEIIKRLPIKSLMRFRSVSKSWKSLIDSSKFINTYHVSNTHPQYHLLVSYLTPVRLNSNYVLVADDDTFPHHKVPLDVSMHLKQCLEPCLIGSSQGLLCFIGNCYSTYSERESDYDAAILWNPSIRKSVSIPVPNVLDQFPYGTNICFGVCPNTNDPTLVKINYIGNQSEIDNISCIPWHVEVFTLSSNVWRSPLGSNLPRKSITLVRNEEVVIDRFIYWYASDITKVGGEFQWLGMILSFDMINEEFTEIFLPDSIALDPHGNSSISMLKESLLVLEYSFRGAGKRVYDVWIMDHISVSKPFTKLYTIKTPILNVRGFRKSGEPIIQMRIDSERQESLFVYEPNSQHIYYIGVSGYFDGDIYSYKETLLLLDY